MKKIALFCSLLLLAFQSFAQDKLPNVELKDLQGKTVGFKEQIKEGELTVISFWATWCAPCKKELDNVAEVYPDWQKEYGVKLIAVSVDEARTVPKVKPTVDAKGWEYQILLDSNQELQRALNINSVPFTLIINKKGEIVYQHSGYKDGDEDKVAEKLAELSKAE